MALFAHVFSDRCTAKIVEATPSSRYWRISRRQKGESMILYLKPYMELARQRLSLRTRCGRSVAMDRLAVETAGRDAAW